MVNAPGRAAVVLEREEDLLTADSRLRAAEQGAGSVLILDGPAGIGKTSLLGAIAHRAQRRQVVCLWATGAERERDLEWSVVRSLFAGSVEAMSVPARAELERGAARMALPLVGDSRRPGRLPIVARCSMPCTGSWWAWLAGRRSSCVSMTPTGRTRHLWAGWNTSALGSQRFASCWQSAIGVTPFPSSCRRWRHTRTHGFWSRRHSAARRARAYSPTEWRVRPTRRSWTPAAQ